MALKEIFEEGTGKNKILKAVAALVLGYFGVTLLWLIPPTVHIDFACGASISEEGCIIGYMRGDPALEGVETRNIEVYLDYYEAGTHGMGCLYRVSDTDEVTVNGYLFQREAEKLTIDEKESLEENESWENVGTVSLWNPWRLTKERISVTNHGVITCARDYEGNITSYGPTLIAIGSIGTYYAPNYVGIAIGVPACALILGLLLKPYLS